MSHLSDKDLDHIAREAAEQLDVDQNSSGWEALQSKLDVEMPVEKRRRRWFFFLVFPLLGGILYYAYQANKVQNEIAEVKSEQVSKSYGQTPGSAEQASSTPGKISDSNPANSNDQASSSSTGSKASLPTNGQADKETADKNSSAADQATIQPADKKLSSSTAAPKANTASNNPIAVTAPPAGIKTSGTGKRDKNRSNLNSDHQDQHPVIKSRSTPNNSKNDITKDNSFTDNLDAQPANTTELDTRKDAETTSPISLPGSAAGEAPAQPLDSSVSSAKPAAVDSALTANPSLPKKAKSRSKTDMPYKGLTLGLVVGPDISEVNKKGTDKTGINFGMVAAYRFNGRLSVVSGFSYTHKFYTAYGKDYKPNKGTWLDTVSLSKVVGDCYMFELPINLRFDVLASRKNYAFVSAGLSSYFMKKENYDFHYTNYSGQYDSRYRSYKVSEDYLFKVLNLSVGYERMLTRRLSMQLEPYIKLPLNGLGFGNMQLSSYGAFFGVKYHAGKLKAR